MPSPFPGMNPYLEGPDLWVDFHDSLIIALRNQLSAALRPRYFVSLQHNVYIHELPDEPGVRIGKPDLYIRGSGPVAAGGSAILEAPRKARIIMPVEEERIPYLAITDQRSNLIITVIELLSPSNKKPGPDREQYLTKRRQLLKSPAHFVEIDLLRGWPKMPAEDYPDCDYSVMVSRAEKRPTVEVWPALLREKLPTIAIPLRERETEPQVDLQQLLHEVYDAASFDLVAYEREPEPPLDAADMAWANEIIRATGVRLSR